MNVSNEGKLIVREKSAPKEGNKGDACEDAGTLQGRCRLFG